MAMSTILFLSLLSLLLPPPSTANESNILVTGDILSTDGQLSYNDTSFVIQDDCNLVLYNKPNGFQSNTHGMGTNCTLTLSDVGQLLIKDEAGREVWFSSSATKKGNYAAILGPDGQVNIYGPSIWSSSNNSSSHANVDEEPNNVPYVRNVLFSSQTLHGNSTLSSRDYNLEITNECNLEFSKKSVGLIWQSETKGKGQNCFVRLDNYGLVSLVDEQNNVLWASMTVGEKGDYVLVVQIHGQAVVYGPIVWSTHY